MRISDILRTMADVVDQAEGGAQEQPAPEPVAEPVVQATAIQGEIETPAAEPTDASIAMISPLQQEHELLKKSAGDSEEDFQNELAAMKQAAGVGEDNSPHNYAEDIKPISMNPRAVAATEAHGKQDRRLQHTQRNGRQGA